MAARPPSAHLLLCANDLWNVANFRLRLVEALEAAGYKVSIAGPPDASWQTRLALANRRILPLPMRKAGLAPWHEGMLLFRFLRLLRRERPDLLLTFTPKPNIYGALAAGALGIPAVPNVSGLGTAFIRGGPLRRLLSLLYRRAFRAAPVVLFQNEDDQRLFLQEGLASVRQARLLPGSGVDLQRFQPQPARSADSRTHFLFVGRLLGDKGVRELVEAARLVRPRFPHVRVQLLGFVDAANRTAIGQDELDAWVGNGIVDYLGSSDDVRPFLAQADAVVLPSYREGLPRSLLEAAAMGKPLIATDVPGNRAVVEDGGNGFLCEPRDALALATALERFLSLSPDERRQLGQRARQKIVAGFSETKVIDAYTGVIEQLLRAKAQA